MRTGAEAVCVCGTGVIAVPAALSGACNEDAVRCSGELKRSGFSSGAGMTTRVEELDAMSIGSVSAVCGPAVAVSSDVISSISSLEVKAVSKAGGGVGENSVESGKPALRRARL